MFHVKHSLPSKTFAEFSGELRSLTSSALTQAQLRRLYAHYEELARWIPTTSLIGPGTMAVALERHYAESLAALELIDTPPRNLVDVGSGAGFPGFVLGAMLGSTQTFLVEAKQKKWAFLMAAARHARLDLVCLHARVSDPLPRELPDEVDLLTLRALRLPTAGWRALLKRLPESGRVFLWTAARSAAGADSAGFEALGLEPIRELGIRGSKYRKIIVLKHIEES